MLGAQAEEQAEEVVEHREEAVAVHLEDAEGLAEGLAGQEEALQEAEEGFQAVGVLHEAEEALDEVDSSHSVTSWCNTRIRFSLWRSVLEGTRYVLYMQTKSQRAKSCFGQNSQAELQDREGDMKKSLGGVCRSQLPGPRPRSVSDVHIHPGIFLLLNMPSIYNHRSILQGLPHTGLRAPL